METTLSTDTALYRGRACSVWSISAKDAFVYEVKQGFDYFVVALADGGHISADDETRLPRLQEQDVLWMPFEGRCRIEGATALLVEIPHGTREPREAREPLMATSSVSTEVGTKMLLSNDVVNVWDFRIAAGQQCHLHQHLLDYFFVNLKPSQTQALDEANQLRGAPQFQEAMQLTYVELASPAVHAVLNVGTEEFKQIIVELKPKACGLT
jgi:hypothetical protein